MFRWKTLVACGLLFGLLSVLAGCTYGARRVEPTLAPSAADAARAYFDVYARRRDFDAFLGFYADDAELIDVISGQRVMGKAAIREFFRWDRGEFTLLSPGPALRVTRQLHQGQTVITAGVFERVRYRGELLGPWEFVLWQEYGPDGRIVRQTDWINYSPKRLLIGQGGSRPTTE